MGYISEVLADAGRELGVVGPSAAPTVLVVDDEISVARVFRRLLSRSGVEVLVARDGRQALSILDGGAVDVVVTDLHVPQLDGIELLRQIRSRDRDLPVVLVTGDPDIESAIEAVALGALRYLRKPVEPGELESVVMEAARRRRLSLLAREARRHGTVPVAKVDARLARRFRSALDRLWIAYQPIVSWSERRVVAYEALCRSDEEGLAGPGPIFAAAAQLGQTQALGRRIRELAVQVVPELPAGGSLFLNLLPADLLDDELFDARGALAGAAERVVLEITERSSLDEVPELQRRIGDLRARGFRIAVDDLGAGYSSLSSFAQLTPDVVKLDMSLVRNVDAEPVKRRLIAGMVAVCRDMGASVIAEGIERAPERDALAECGCDWMQGYFFGRPAPGLIAPRFDSDR